MNVVATRQSTGTTTWNIDPVHSLAEFKAKHMMISSVKGQFAQIQGILVLDEKDLTNSRVEASIEGASINTRDAQRDTHLKSADFLYVEKFPTLSFNSTRVSRSGDGELAVTGDLTIRSASHKLHLLLKDQPHRPRILGEYSSGPSAATTIKRKDFGLTWNAALETGGILVGDEVTITLDVQFVKA